MMIIMIIMHDMTTIYHKFESIQTLMSSDSGVLDLSILILSLEWLTLTLTSNISTNHSLFRNSFNITLPNSLENAHAKQKVRL